MSRMRPIASHWPEKRPGSWMLLFFGLVLGCSDAPTEAPSGAPSSALKTASAAPKTVGSTFCKDVCERAAGCGADAAKALRRNKQDDLALASAQALTEANTKTCIETCLAPLPTPLDEAHYDRARQCLKADSCVLFQRCLEETAKPAASSP